MSREAAIEKITRILGPERASLVLAEGLRSAGIQDLDTPVARLKFGRVLTKKGGVLEAIGRAITIQAILEGAEDAETGR